MINGHQNVAPSRLEELRIAGDKTITPPDEIKALAPGSIKSSFKFCVAETGEVSDVKVLQPSPYRTYDEDVIRKMQRWKFRPYLEDGKAIAVCSAIAFIYSQHGPR